jgi:hypothetical protein
MMKNGNNLAGIAGGLVLAGCCASHPKLIEGVGVDVEGYRATAMLYENGTKCLLVGDLPKRGVRAYVAGYDSNKDGKFDTRVFPKKVSKEYMEKFDEFTLERLEKLWYEAMDKREKIETDVN